MGEKKKETRGRRRITLYGGGTLTVALTKEMRRVIEREANSESLPNSEIIRRALARGLPLVVDAGRKRRRNQAAHHDPADG